MVNDGVFEISSSDVFPNGEEYAINFQKDGLKGIYPQCHAFCELCFVCEGEMKMSMEENSLTMAKGSLVLLAPWTAHSKALPIDLEHINLAFTWDKLEPLLSYFGSGFVELLKSRGWLMIDLSTKEIEELRDVLEQLLRSPEGTGRSRFLFRNIMMNVMQSFGHDQMVHWNERSAESVEKRGPDWLLDFSETLRKDDGYTSPFDHILKRVPVSQAHFGRVMKKHWGITPTKYINDLRLNHAAQWLRQSDKEITVVALDSGFENLSHFYHLFKVRYKMSPRQYRAKHSFVL
jgi:AraC family cel operon transcriptional repressor